MTRKIQKQNSTINSQSKTHKDPKKLPSRVPKKAAAATPPIQGGELGAVDPRRAKAIRDCRELYLAYGGESFALIEAEMRTMGHRFYRQVLYSKRRKNGTLRLGWPERFGWKKELSRQKAAGGRRKGQKELLRDFPGWLKTERPDWTWTWAYQRYLYKRLNDFTLGRSRRLMIFMPPRHGKSEMVTIRYVAWRLMREVGLNVILASHTQKLAERFSRRVKRIVATSDLPPRQPQKTAAATPPIQGGELAWRRVATASE